MAYHRSLVELITLNNDVPGPVGIVYSTAPKTAIGADGRTYYVKGCNSAIAYSEVCGCRLAAAVGLPTPRADIGLFVGDVYAAVTEVEHKIQNVVPWLNQPNGVANIEDLFGAIVVDCWLANDDRNMGNLVGVAVADRQIALRMIDFEKSKTLGESPTISAASLDPRRLWPTGELGMKLRNGPTLRPPQRYIDAIGSIRDEVVSDIVMMTAAHVPTVNWAPASVEVLLARARRIRILTEEIWQRN